MNYDDQLERAMSEKPSETAAGDRFEVPDPVVRTEGNVTVYENFRATHDRLARQPRHLRSFLQSTLGTSAEIDDVGRARFTGSFSRERIADALAEYVDTYVRCDECRSPDTRLVTDDGATVLRCDACGATSPVPEP
jgi:translation initiation factor 2 subunit 2